jgi:hypothetical protein
MKNRQYESMTKIVKNNLTVRVWRTEQEFTTGNNSDIKAAIVLANADLESISEILDTFPNVAAYEILDEEGNGALVYPDWN